MRRKRQGPGLRTFRLDGLRGSARSIWHGSPLPAPPAESGTAHSGIVGYLSALDLGTTHLKAAVCQVQSGQVVVLGQAVEPWAGRLQGAGNRVNPTLVEACERLVRQAEDMTEEVAGRKVVADQLIVGLPAAAVQVGTHTMRYNRSAAGQPISAAELEHVLVEAQRAALRSLSDDAGRPTDMLLLLPCSRADIAIDGRTVDDPVGLRGSAIRVHSFNARAPRSVIQVLETLADAMKFDPPNVAIESQAVLIAHGQALGSDGLGIDLGGRNTTMLLWRDGMLQQFATFPAGGSDVTAILGRACHLDERGAERLKADYVAGRFDDGQRQWIQGILHRPLQRWADQLSRRLATWSEQSPLPANVWLWGGGSLLREAEEVVRWAAQGIAFVGFPRIQRLADVTHPDLLNRAGGSTGTLVGVAHSMAVAQAARMRAAPEAGYAEQATRTAGTLEHIPFWEPVDG